MAIGGLWRELRRDKAPAWTALAALGALFFLITAGTFSSLGVVLPDMVKALRWDWTGAGLGFTLLGLATGLASYAPTLVTRQGGVRLTLLLGAVVTAAGFLCLFATHGLKLYWLGAVLAGFGFALCAIIPGTFVLARAFRARSMAIGIYFTVGGLGGVAGPWLYLAVLRLHGDWRDYWLCLAAAVLALGVFAALVSEPPAADPEPDAAEPEVIVASGRVYRAARSWSVRDALHTPQFWIVVAAYTTYLLCEVTVNGLSVQHLTERGASFTLAGGLLSAQALISVFARAAGGLAGERIDPRKLVILAMACLAVGVAALALAHGLPLMIVYAIGVGTGYGLAYLATTVLLLNYFGRERNLELFSLMCLVSTLASAGPFLGGLAHDRLGGFAPALWGFAGVAALVLAAVALMRPPSKEGAR
ncbi:MAG TPA: MFS transporter [Caulobacteraceae bacterium]|jgi:MFS family permease|nr:MFS transporter [Caulobacteraceae bacterium]